MKENDKILITDGLYKDTIGIITCIDISTIVFKPIEGKWKDGFPCIREKIEYCKVI